MRRANNTGTIFKLKGNRHNPYVAYVYGEKVINEEKGTTYRKRKAIGYYPTRKDAQEGLQEYLNQPFDLTNRDITLQEVWDIVYPSLKLSESRLNNYTLTYNKYISHLSNMRMKDIKTVHIEEIIDNCAYGSATKTDIKAVLSKCFTYCIKNDILQTNYTQLIPIEKSKPKKQRVIFTVAEIDKMWKRQKEWAYRFMLLLIYTGVRPVELISLKKENVNLEQGYFDIVGRGEKGVSKTEAGVRVVPIHKDIYPMFEDLMKKDGQYLIQTDRGCQVCYKNFTAREFKEINQYLEVEHTLYDTRHTWGTYAKKCGMDDFYKRAMFGHKQETLIEDVYTHATLKALKEEMNKLKYDEDV